jgi:hypothetical protein
LFYLLITNTAVNLIETETFDYGKLHARINLRSRTRQAGHCDIKELPLAERGTILLSIPEGVTMGSTARQQSQQLIFLHQDVQYRGIMRE